ncbi:MAG: single-stranded-DNA-specific exonuclease RecJ [Parvularculaceae bacterium]
MTGKTAIREIGESNGGFIRLALPAMKMPASGRRWTLKPFDEANAAAIDAAIGGPSVLARLLAARSVKAGDAARYLNPSLRDELPDPSTLADMDRAARRLADAIVSGAKCGVFGDYDVDGTSAAAILYGYFAALDAPLEVYLPDRILEGYGPTIEAFRTLKQKGAATIITVDCGAAAHEAINAAASEGVDIVVLDHHQMDGPPPEGAAATVNPHRQDDQSGLVDLSATGVAFMTIVALNRELRSRGWFKTRKEPDLLQFLDLVALGLVCDVMPMTGLARTITAQGLKVLSSNGNEGLATLGKRAGMKGAASAYDLGFRLGPRINAAGRVGHARIAFELLTTNDVSRRAALTEKLHLMNAERQAIERDVEAQAIAQIEKRGLNRNSAIVAAGEGWHPGVVGIVAGRIKDRYDRPAVIIGLDKGVGKGSGRSLSGVDLGGAVRAARQEGLLIAGGGHAMAAGLTIAADAIEGFSAFLNITLKSDVDRALAERRRDIDSVMNPSAVTAATAEAIARAGPFGPGNPEPIFVLADMRVEAAREVGEGHLSCRLVTPDGEAVRAIAFRALGERLGELLLSGGRLHIAGKIKADDWRNDGSGQFQIADVAEAVDSGE